MMKRLSIVCGVLAFGLAAETALAADLPLKAPPVVAPVFSWAGPYIGLNVGYGWSSETVSGSVTGTTTVKSPAGTTVTPLAPVPLYGGGSLDGVLGGGQLGYNWQFANWLVGLEGDFQGTGQRKTYSVCTAVGCPTGSTVVTADNRLSWFGTDRVRFGYLPTERLVLYGTGGLAFGSFRSEAGQVLSVGPNFDTWTSLRAGWTAGAGLETALGDNWSFKLEYLYMDFGNVPGPTVTGTTVTTVRTTTTTVVQNYAFNTRFTDNVVRIGFNYRFGGPPTSAAADK
jgi:outer membrane immunogenic protein